MILKVIVQIWKRILVDLMPRMLARAMFYQLVLSVVLDVAELTGIWLVISVTPLMIFAIPNSGELFLAKVALIRLLSSMSPHMHEQVTFLGKDFTAAMFNALKEVVAAVSTFDV